METPVKERLVGAIILVLLLAVLVPEFLSGPKHPPPAPSAGQGAAVRTYTIDLASPGVSKPAEAPTVQQPLTVPPPVASPAPAAAEQKNVPAPVPLPRPSSAPPQTQSPASASTASSQTPASSKAPAARIEATSVRSTTAASGWAVQLGSFSRSDNADRLVKELRSRGYKAFVSRSGTGAKLRYRVRVGPEEERSQAQKLADRLKREGRQVSVVSQP